MTIQPTTTRLSAWDTLGRPLLSTTDAKTALDNGALSRWNIRKTPAFTTVTTREGKQVTIPMPGRNAVIYDKPEGGIGYLGDVGNVHTTMQNEAQIELLDIFVREAGATFETAGLAGGGRRVFITMKLPGGLMIGGVDPVDCYVASINAHDASMKHTLAVTPTRFACMNMLNLLMKDHKWMIQVRHTRAAEATLRREAHELVARTFAYLDAFQETAEQLINTTVTQRRFEEIIANAYGAKEDAAEATVTRAENRIDKIVELFADANTQAGIRETAWAGLNAIVEYSDHFFPTRGEERDVARAERAIFDTTFKNNALKLMLAEV